MLPEREPQLLMALVPQGEGEPVEVFVEVVCEGNVVRLVSAEFEGGEFQFVRSELAGAVGSDMSGRRAAA